MLRKQFPLQNPALSRISFFLSVLVIRFSPTNGTNISLEKVFGVGTLLKDRASRPYLKQYLCTKYAMLLLKLCFLRLARGGGRLDPIPQASLWSYRTLKPNGIPHVKPLENTTPSMKKINAVPSQDPGELC